MGGGLFELSRCAEAVVGLDRGGAFLRAAQVLLSGAELPFARRMAGRAYLRAVVRALGWSIEDEADLPWTLRRDARSLSVYQTHYLRARRGD